MYYAHQSVTGNSVQNVIYCKFSSNMHYSNDRHITKIDTLVKNDTEED